MLCDNYNGFTTYQGMSSYTFTVLWWCISSILHQTYTTPMCLSVTWFNSRWYLCPALHPISQKFPHCWMVSVRCAPPHQSEVSPLLDGICALRSTPSLRSFPIVGWYLCAALHPISQKFPHCWMVSVRCAPPHLSEVSPLLDGICALRSIPSLRSFPIVGWYLCAALHPISQKFPHCWMVSVRCAPSHLSEVSPLLDGICALHSTPSLRSFPIVGWYVCAALHPISQKFPHCCLWNSLNVRLIDDGPLLNFQRRLSSTSSFHASHRLSVYIIRLVQKGE